MLKQWIANTAPTTMADRIRQAHAFFRNRTTEQNLTTAAPWTSPWLPDGYGQDFWSGAMNAPEEPAANREVDAAERARVRAEFRERLAAMDREWTPERWAELRSRHGRDAADAA